MLLRKLQKHHFLGFHGNHNQKKKIISSFHKTKYNKHLQKKIGQMEEYFSRKKDTHCQISYFEKLHHKVNKAKNE